MKTCHSELIGSTLTWSIFWRVRNQINDRPVFRAGWVCQVKCRLNRFLTPLIRTIQNESYPLRLYILEFYFNRSDPIATIRLVTLWIAWLWMMKRWWFKILKKWYGHYNSKSRRMIKIKLKTLCCSIQ